MTQYSVQKIFFTLQGEGNRTGRASVFCRFIGCNLWSGREQDRHKAICQFCDTDFINITPQGGKFDSATKLTELIEQNWLSHTNNNDDQRYVVFTGGEPLLQLDKNLINILHAKNFEIAVETNGTIKLPTTIDWVCVSPKANNKLIVTTGNELKLVWPQDGLDLNQLQKLNFDYFFLQPMDCANYQDNLNVCIEQCKQNPQWRLSLQTHKIIGIE